MHELRDEDPAQLAIRVLNLDSQLNEERIRGHQLQSSLTQEQIQLRECRASLQAANDDLRKAQRQVQDKDKEVAKLTAQLQDVVLSRRGYDTHSEGASAANSGGPFRANEGKRGRGEDRWIQCDLLRAEHQQREEELAGLRDANQALTLRVQELECTIADFDNQDDDVYTEDSGDLNGDDAEDGYRPEPPKFKLNFNLPPALHANDGDEIGQGSFGASALEETPRMGTICLKVNQQINIQHMMNSVSQRQLTARDFNTKHPMVTPRGHALPTPRGGAVVRKPFTSGMTVDPADSSYGRQRAFGQFSAGGASAAPGPSTPGGGSSARQKRGSDLEQQRPPSADRRGGLASSRADASTAACPDDDADDGSWMLERKDTAMMSQPRDREPLPPLSPPPLQQPQQPQQPEPQSQPEPQQPEPPMFLPQPQPQPSKRNSVLSNSIAADGTLNEPHMKFVSMPHNLPEEREMDSGSYPSPNHHAASDVVALRGDGPSESSFVGSQPQRQSQGIGGRRPGVQAHGAGNTESPEPASPEQHDDLVRLRFMEEGQEGSPRSLFSVEREVDASRCLVCELIDHIQFTYSGKMKSRAAYYAVGWLPEICQRWQLEHSLVWTIEERATVATTLQNRPYLSSFTHSHFEDFVKVHRFKKNLIWDSHAWVDSYALLQGIFLYTFNAKAPRQRVVSVISVRGATIEMCTTDPKAPHSLKISALGCRTCAGAGDHDGVDELILRFDTAKQLAKCRQALLTMQMTCPHQCSAKFAQEVESFKEIAELLLSMSLREEREHKRMDSKRRTRQKTAGAVSAGQVHEVATN